MKNRGFLLTISIILALVCLFQLTFTWKARSFENKALAWAQKMHKSNPSGLSVDKLKRQFIDENGNKTLYNTGLNKYNYYACKGREINLGLDLRGGMNVLLEVDKAKIISGLSNDENNDVLKKALSQTDNVVRTKGGDYVSVFMDEIKKVQPNIRLANLFVKGNSGKIKIESSDRDIAAYLKEETDGSIDRVFEVVNKRINQSNLTQPTIQKTGDGRINVELPGVDNPKSMENLLEKSANLEFYPVFSPEEAGIILRALYSKASGTDTTAVKRDSTGKIIPDTNKKPVANVAKFDLQKYLIPMKGGKTADDIYGGKVKGAMRDKLDTMLGEDRFASILLANKAKIAYGAKTINEDNANEKKIAEDDEYQVYLLRLNRDFKAAMTSEDGNIIKDANANTQNGKWEISMQMNPEASAQWAQLTGDNINRQIAIVLDGRVYSAPNVNGKITGGNSSITGNFDVKEASDLANVLKAGKLPAPARIVASENVGPTLGSASITKGAISLLCGFLSIVVFMIFYYNRAGFISVVALLANVFLIAGVLAGLGTALTLPGIAGVILTVGMAVDANVLIYERIREELRGGKSLKTAIDLGFKHALSAIIDGNITTLLAGIILTFTGSGPAYGFAIILVIGIFSSLFTALVITRMLLDNRTRKNKDTSFSYAWNEKLLVNSNYDFVGKRRVYFLVSLPIIALGIIMYFSSGGLSAGIDFKGGNAFVIQTNPAKNYSSTDIKEKLDVSLKGTSNEVKTYGTEGGFKIVTTHMINEKKVDLEKVGTDVLNSLKGIELVTKNNDPNTSILSKTKVEATVATSTRNKSIILLILATIGMFLYIVLRFRNVAYAAGATIATLHDIIVVICVFIILHKIVPFPLEFDQNLIAALLTIVGYSMNDTVIVFDRIREFLNEKRNTAEEASLINGAINQTLSRTIVTSLTVFLVVLVLFIFGGDSLKGFSLAMMIGVIIGTYSSIFIATPVVLEFGTKKNKLKR